MTPPVLVYLGMGLLVARIMLDGRPTRGLTWLQWLQYLVDGARITLLWPLVLLIEKVETWLKADAVPHAGAAADPAAAQPEEPAGALAREELRALEKARAVEVTGDPKP